MKHILAFLILWVLASASALSAQDTLSTPRLAIGTGFMTPIWEGHAYAVTLPIHVGINLRPGPKELLIRPQITFLRSRRVVDEFIQEVNSGVDLALLAAWEFKLGPGKARLYPFLGVGWGRYTDYFAPRRPYEGDRLNLMTGRGMSGQVGLGLKAHPRLCLEAFLHLFQPGSVLTEEVQEANDDGSLIYEIYSFPRQRLNFNKFGLRFVVNL